ncbi:MAG: 50S ribosomal protein L20 [Candidatus Alcyoniella australis]|nr:50S ribosomal protein L20 [Candidatus Alcyoniella australis]
MSRVRRGFKGRRRHNKLLKQAKGYRHGRSKIYRSAKETVERALVYAYRDRRTRRRDMRSLWIVRINAAAKLNGLSYSRFIHGLKLAGVGLDRKVLAELAVNDADAFRELTEVSRQALEA